MKISLAKWAELNFDPAPHIDTLRSWARTGKIYPPPFKAGRAYYVDEHAVYIADVRRRLVDRIQQ